MIVNIKALRIYRPGSAIYGYYDMYFEYNQRFNIVYLNQITMCRFLPDLTINTVITFVNIVNTSIVITIVKLFCLQKYIDYICKNYRK